LNLPEATDKKLFS